MCKAGFQIHVRIVRFDIFVMNAASNINNRGGLGCRQRIESTLRRALSLFDGAESHIDVGVELFKFVRLIVNVSTGGSFVQNYFRIKKRSVNSTLSGFVVQSPIGVGVISALSSFANVRRTVGIYLIQNQDFGRRKIGILKRKCRFRGFRHR